MINITRINHVALNTPSDVDSLQAFYTEHLGVQTVARDIPEEFAAMIPGFWMQFSNGQVHVIQNDTEHQPGNPLGRHLAFYVSDLDAAESYLEQSRINCQRVDSILFFADPAGNTIELQQDPEL